MKANCKGCPHEIELERGSSTCNHPDVKDKTCSLVAHDMLKVLANIVLELVVKKDICGGIYECLFCEAYGGHSDDCIVPILEKYYEIK